MLTAYVGTFTMTFRCGHVQANTVAAESLEVATEIAQDVADTTDCLVCDPDQE